MLLASIYHNLKENPGQTLSMLSHSFGIEIDILSEMLKVLIQKGKIKKSLSQKQCETACASCSDLNQEVFECLSTR